MKCDTDPIACQPCRQKTLRCFTTDRVTGHARERGASDRVEGEVSYLRDQLNEYQRRYGILGRDHRPPAAAPHTPPKSGSIPGEPPIPSAHYVGWPAPEHAKPLRRGPVNGTKVDILDEIIDVADFDCDQMENPQPGEFNIFNASRTSIVNTIFGYQATGDLKLPSKEQALSTADHFLVIMSPFVPILHRPSFRDLVRRFYDHPNAITIAERVQVLVVLAIIAQQTAVRNHAISAEQFDNSHQYLHAALGYYRDVYHDMSLPAMQALTLIVVYFRNLPKPGVTWSFSNQVLVRAIELKYNRDPDKIELPPNQQTVLAKELRKRVFHSLFGICVTTGCRVGLPAPWHFQHFDVPLPTALKDDELSADGIAQQRSGACEFHPCLSLSRQLPLLTELHNNIISVRRPEHEYLQVVDALNTKILAWKQDWDDSVKNSEDLSTQYSTHLMEQWTAEYQLNLHHPSVCTSTNPDVMEKNLDVCHKAAKKLLSAFHTLSSKYKAVDFTWHSTVAYATGFGVTLFIYKRRKSPVSREQYNSMCNELKGWMTLMAYADLVLRTGNHLQRLFEPRVKALEDEYRRFIAGSPTPAQQPTSNTFQSVNGVSPQHQMKPEPGPSEQQQQQQSLPPQRSQPQHMPMPPPSATSTYSTTPNASTQSQHAPWTSYQTAPTPIQYQQPTNQPNQQQSYAPYPSPMSSAQQQHHGQHYRDVPTSLAPLLNSTNGMYVTYPNHSQAQTQTAGPIANDYNNMMSFSPTHYYEPNGPASWPMINMPHTAAGQ